MLDVQVANRQRKHPVDARRLRELARFVLQAERIAASEISVVFVDPRAMQRINRDFLGHDYVTDVVTFPLGEDLDPLIGEIVICPAFAEQWAADVGWSVEMETSLYLVHGLLHLCGYDDKRSAPAARMRRRQKDLLDQFNAANPPRAARRKAATRTVKK